MTNKPRRIGTEAENGVVDYLLAHGFPNAERRSLEGVNDRGDVTGCLGLVWEVKGGKAAESAGDGLIEDWLQETERERVKAKADYGILVVKRKGYGRPRAGSWWAIMPMHSLAFLYLLPAGVTWTDSIVPVRMLFAEAVELCRRAGYGDPL